MKETKAMKKFAEKPADNESGRERIEMKIELRNFRYE